MKTSICSLAVLISLGACSHQQAVDGTSTESATAGSGDATRLSDGLIAPSQPVLSIEAAPETLILSWQSGDPAQSANVYEYDTLTREEKLLAGNLSAQISTFQIPGKTPTRLWNTQQFRVELCDEQDCVSSDRVSIDTFAASTSQTLRPGVFLLGERFAESVTANYDASLVASTLPVEGAVQIHFHNQNQWVAIPPIRLDLDESSTLLDISSSHTGDTLAVLASSQNNLLQSASVSILDRLGETWIETAELPVPVGITLDPVSRIELSAEADQLYLHTPERLHIFHRNDLDWSLQPSISPPVEPDSRLAATHVRAGSKQIHALLTLSGTLWLASYDSGDNTSATAWQETSRQVVQGIDPYDDVFLQGSADGSVLIVAGWDASILEEKSPVLYRFNVNGAIRNVDRALIINASSRLAPTQHDDASLRFSANENLETLALGWHSLSGEDAKLSTLTFDEREQRYRVALELPLAVPTLAKQSFASDVALSSDGQTLLVSTLPGHATPPSNRAGELMIFR